MARHVYFAFHYADVESFRANVVRNSWRFKDREDAGFFDTSLWEKVKKEGDLAIKRMINKGVDNTSVTAVLAGTFTYSRRWVRYEIIKSFTRGNGLMTIYIHNIPDKNKTTCKKGGNPLDHFYFRLDEESGKIHLWEWNLDKKAWDFLESIPQRNVKFKFGNVKEGQFSKLFPAYDWVTDNGNQNFGKWVEASAVQAGR